MSLRVIGGAFRNRLLKSPKGVKTRPTTAIMRKAVFDICQFEIEGVNFLDIFAGSGLMGFEALSRGAANATFIDHDRSAIRCIQENARMLNLERQTTILQGDALSMLKRLSLSKTRYQLAYIDPPYGQNIFLKKNLISACEGVLQFLDTYSLIAPGGAVFVEEAVPGQLTDQQLFLKTLIYKDTRKFGKSVLHQYRNPLY